MRLTFTCFLFSISFLLKSQNWINVTTDYINNPSFEDFNNCPQFTSDPSNYWVDSCKYWSHVTYTSADFHHSCQNALSNPLVGVPNNYVMRYQMPYEGNGYLGFYPYSLINLSMWCEYVQSSLIKKLEAGKKYKFKMRIIPSKYNAYGISKIGVHLSSNSLVNNTQWTSFKFTPTMLNSNGIIADTTKWFLFEEEFIANGLENHITIGWFADTVTSDNGYFDTLTNQLDYYGSYYAIDSLNLMEYKSEFDIKEFNINIITPNDDNVNEVIDFSKYNLISLNFNIYNRWGKQMFVSKDNNLKWWGKNDMDEPLSDGVYYYILQAVSKDTKETVQKTGHISIIH